MGWSKKLRFRGFLVFKHLSAFAALLSHAGSYGVFIYPKDQTWSDLSASAGQEGKWGLQLFHVFWSSDTSKTQSTTSLRYENPVQFSVQSILHFLMILDKHSWNWRPHQIGSLFVYHKASVFQPFSASLIYHWCMHRDLILEYETWRRDESHEFGRGQLRAFLDDFQFKDIPDLADSSSLIGSTSWKKTSEFSLN